MSHWLSDDVTASFMPDGTLTDTGGPSNLFACLDAHLPRSQWQDAYRCALAAWQEVCGLKITWVDDDGSPCNAEGARDQGHPGRGDIRFGGRHLDGGLAGLTYYPAQNWLAGCSFLATQFIYRLGTNIDLYSVVLHEAGHALGLLTSRDPTSVMYQSIGVNAKLGTEDVQRIQALYGPPPVPPLPPPILPDRYEPNNSTVRAAYLGVLPRLTLTGLTLHAVDDQDWFTFTARDSGNFVITAEFEQVDGTSGTFFMAVFGTAWKLLGRGSAESINGKGAVTGTIALVAGWQYHLRLLSPSGGLFRYDLKISVKLP